MNINYRNLWIGFATFGGAIYLSATSQPAASPQPSDRTVKRVHTAEVSASSSSREIRFSGVTRAIDRARLSFALGGRMIERTVEVGDRVSQGELLARLDDRELRNAEATARGNLAELEARREQMQRDVERAERLLAKKAATPEEAEKQRAGLAALVAAEQAAIARLREAKRLMSETRLSAPFAGTITEVHFQPGEVVNPGQAIVLLSGDGAVELEVEVPESIVPRIAIGEEVAVILPSRGRTPVPATIASVGRAASGPGSLFPVRVKLSPDAGAPAGATAELLLSLTNERALALPVEAVVNPGGRSPAVFRVDRASGQVEKVSVEVGSLLVGRVVVRGQLEIGDQVVIGGQRGLLDGETVEIVDPTLSQEIR